MKVLILLSFILSCLISDSQLVSNIDKILQKIIVEDKTKIVNDIKVDYDPFNNSNSKTISKQVKKGKSPKPNIKSNKLYLSMIMNKKAFINGKWYKENDKFADYVIIKVNQDIVVLKKKNRYLTLKLSTSKQILATKEEK